MNPTFVTKPRPKKTLASTKTASVQNPPATNKKISINSTDRQQLIATTAYFKAEARGFEGDDSLGDWLAAEAEIDSQYFIKP